MPADTSIDLSDESVEKAQKIHAKSLILDAHADIVLPSTSPQHLASDGLSKVAPEKLKAGGVDAVVMSVAVGPGPRNAEGNTAAVAETEEKLAVVRQLLNDHPDELVLTKSAREIEAAKENGKIALVLGFQNARALGGNVASLDGFYAAGARVFGFCHMGHNDFADSSRPLLSPAMGIKEPIEEHGGLSSLGRAGVSHLNALGGLIDVSQLSKAATLETIELSKTPVIASHSNVRALSNVTRNLSDEEIDQIGATGGVIHVAAFVIFLVGLNDPEFVEKIYAARVAAGITEKFSFYPMELYWEIKDAENQQTFVLTMRELMSDINVKTMVDHIDYIVDRIGIEHVGVGNDFNHGTSIPGYQDASEAYNLTLELVNRGYSEDSIAKLWSSNFLRALREAESAKTIGL